MIAHSHLHYESDAEVSGNFVKMANNILMLNGECYVYGCTEGSSTCVRAVLFAELKLPSRCIHCLICTATFPPLFRSPMARCTFENAVKTRIWCAVSNLRADCHRRKRSTSMPLATLYCRYCQSIFGRILNIKSLAP